MTTAIRELTDLQQTLLRHIYQLRLLTTSQACELTGASRRTVQWSLRQMATVGLLAEVHGPPPGRERRWLCTETGRETAEATREVTPRAYQLNETVASSSAHLIGTNNVGIALTSWARRYGDDISWELEVPHPYGKTNAVITDAVLTYTLTTAAGDVVPLWRFVEYDRGTESGHILVEKLRSYVEVAGYRPPIQEGQAHRPPIEWQRRYPTLPHVLFVFGDMTEQQADARFAHVIGNVSSDPYLTEHAHTITIWATTLHELQTSDPFTDDIITQIPHGEQRPLHTRR